MNVLVRVRSTYVGTASVSFQVASNGKHPVRAVESYVPWLPRCGDAENAIENDECEIPPDLWIGFS